MKKGTRDKFTQAGTKSAPEQMAQKAEKEDAKVRKQKRGQTQKADGSRKEKQTGQARLSIILTD